MGDEFVEVTRELSEGHGMIQKILVQLYLHVQVELLALGET